MHARPKSLAKVLKNDVLSYLDPNTLARTAEVSREYSKLAVDEKLWKKLTAEMKVNVPAGQHPKTAYINSLPTKAERWNQKGRTFVDAHPWVANSIVMGIRMLDITEGTFGPPEEAFPDAKMKELFGFFGSAIGHLHNSVSVIAASGKKMITECKRRR